MSKEHIFLIGLNIKGKQTVKTSSGLGKQKINLQEASKVIDQLVLKNLKEKGLSYKEPVDDETFLRRIYLNIIGRIPSLSETEAFLKNTLENKRSELVKKLHDSEGYVSHNFNYWADVLRAQTAQEGNAENSWLLYLKNSIRKNKPYDKWVNEMLSANGYFWENQAIGFYRRDANNRLAGYEALSGVFLGKQIGCAQCHDHPYDTTTRREYYEMFGFIAMAHPYVHRNKTMTYLDGNEIGEDVTAVFNEWRQKKPRFGQKTRSIWNTAHHTMLKLFRSKITRSNVIHLSSFPADYQYDDGKAKDLLMPKTLFGENPKYKVGSETQTYFANWVTDKKNLKFTYVIVNRLWHKIMGSTIEGNLTDLPDFEECKNKELLKYLAELFISLDYDLKAFSEILYSTRLYQSQSIDKTKADQNSFITGPVMKRMSAEQLWDSLMVLVNPKLDENLRPQKADFSFILKVKDAKTKKEFWDLIIEENKKNSHEDTYSKMDLIKEKGFDLTELKRASEIQQPAPPGHFLRLFGQADRLLVEDHWQNPTVPQALTLLNSHLILEILKDGSPLEKSLKSSTKLEDKISLVFKTFLNRYPGQEEMELTLKALEHSSVFNIQHLCWSLLNTRQFIFIR